LSTHQSLYQTILARICAATAQHDVPLYSTTRLALLVSGILAAKSTTLSRIAAEIQALELTDAREQASIERRLRRTLNDPNLVPTTCYAPALCSVLDWNELLRGSRQVVVAVDESSRVEQIHLLRAALCYWGGSLPLAWVSWPQNRAQEKGHYWQQIDALFSQLAPLLPSGVQVIIVADRAYAVSNFIDRCTALGWHFVLRVTTTGSHRYQEMGAEEQSLREVVANKLSKPGQQWYGRGELFKNAGWREVGIVGLWRKGQAEPLVVVSDLDLGWRVLGYYERRFWIESGFRNDKSGGWRWEQSQVQGQEHHERLLLAMAWASLVSICVGVAEAQQRIAQERERREKGSRGKPQRAKQSIFTQGLRALQRWLYGTHKGTMNWRLGELGAQSWLAQWHQAQLPAPEFRGAQAT
jgi:hypothetical protein